MIGQTISHFRILEKLGEGGMGVVYLAEDTKLDRRVALKFLPPHLNASEQDRARFMQEAKAAAALSHPNVCSIIDVQDDDAQLFIVMEYVEGKTLHETKGLTLKQAIDIGIQIAEGLGAAHEKSIVHRDIKPENIMVRNDGRVQIMDFGLAKLKGISRLTKAGSTVGTAGYMSPEQVQGNDADERSDIFSLGVVLYELFTGQLPFRGVHETAMIYEIVNVDPPPMQTVKPDINPDIDRIVAACLEKDPGERIQSAKQVAIDLKRAARDSGRHPVSGTRDALPQTQKGHAEGAPPAQHGRTRHLKIGAGVLGVCVVTFAAWFFMGRHTGTINSLVVLPFENVGGNTDLEYLSDGVSEGIIYALAKDKQLRVIPRSASFRYKGSPKDPGTIGKELAVDAVLSGRVVQRGDNLDVTAELVDVNAFSQIWGKNYQRTMNDLVTVQNEIVEEVNRHLNLEHTESVANAEHQSADPAAYRLYLQGKYYWNKRSSEGLDRALDYFQQAVVVDPHFALAHLGLAETYLLQSEYSQKPPPDASRRAFDEAMRSLELDGSLGQAHAALGLLHMYSWEWQAAGEEFEQAIDKAPEYASGYQWYAFYLQATGRVGEAMKMVKKAATLDPYSPIILENVAAGYMYLDDYAAARPLLQKILTIDPNFFYARIDMAEIQRSEGEKTKAVAMLDSIAEASLSSFDLGCLACSYGSLGETKHARAIIKRLIEGHWDSAVDPMAFVYAYFGVGETERAIASLQKAYDQRSDLLANMSSVWQLKPLLSDARVKNILRGMGLNNSDGVPSKTK